MTSTALKLVDLTLGYDSHPAIHHIDGDIALGSLTAIIGPNGSGKSTLLKGIVGSLAPLGGRIERIVCDSHDVAYLPQASEIDRTFPATVEDLVALGLWRMRGVFSAITGEDRTLIDNALSAVGLSRFQSRPIETLSGGQLQRALFARVLLQDAKVILLDEPFTAIDGKTVSDLIALVRRWHQEGRTIMAVLHDIDIVREHFPKALLLARETIAWGETRDVVTAENLLRARRMNEAWSTDAPWCDKGAA